MFLLVAVDTASQSSEPAADERAHGTAPACDGRNARPYERTGSSSGQSPLLGLVHMRVRRLRSALRWLSARWPARI